MWEVKTFKTRAAFQKWIDKHSRRYQWEVIYLNNVPYAIEYRKLRRVY